MQWRTLWTLDRIAISTPPKPMAGTPPGFRVIRRSQAFPPSRPSPASPPCPISRHPHLSPDHWREGLTRLPPGKPLRSRFFNSLNPRSRPAEHFIGLCSARAFLRIGRPLAIAKPAAASPRDTFHSRQSCYRLSEGPNCRRRMGLRTYKNQIARYYARRVSLRRGALS